MSASNGMTAKSRRTNNRLPHKKPPRQASSSTCSVMNHLKMRRTMIRPLWKGKSFVSDSLGASKSKLARSTQRATTNRKSESWCGTATRSLAWQAEACSHAWSKRKTQ